MESKLLMVKSSTVHGFFMGRKIETPVMAMISLGPV